MNQEGYGIDGLKIINNTMKDNIMKTMLNNILIAMFVLSNANANNLSAPQYFSEIPLFQSLVKSAPREYRMFERDLRSIDKSVIRDSIVIEFYTDNMVSFGALILAKDISACQSKNNRIHAFRISPELYENCSFLLNRIDSLLLQRRVFDIYKIFEKPSPSPTRYIVFNLNGKSFVLLGLECLSSDKEISFTKGHDINSILCSIKNFLDILRENKQNEILDLITL